MDTVLFIRQLGLQHYETIYQAMRAYTERRSIETADEIWFLQHFPVYTLGMRGMKEHLLDTGAIPVVHTDRGGQVSYHGPGQLVVYLLIDIRRLGLMVKGYVSALEQAVIDYLSRYHIQGERKPGIPGVYVAGKKIAALGIRIKRYRTYHGLSFNVDMDLSPYQGINPCGYRGQEVTSLAKIGLKTSLDETAQALLPVLIKNLHYPEHVRICPDPGGHGILGDLV